MRVPALLLLGLPSMALATDYVGDDYGGADLVLANGDTLSGEFLNVGQFVVPLGATVKVVGRTPLEIYATAATVNGILDASAAGELGGRPNSPPCTSGQAGSGEGEGGGGGGTSYYYYSGGGGGAGYGGDGGIGGSPYYYTDNRGAAGDMYGNETDITDRPLGSGGGAGACDYLAEYLSPRDGGAGGGSIFISAPSSIVIDGSILANGAKGGNAPTNTSYYGEDGGSGGGSGGSVVLETFVLDGAGTVSVSGGNGGNVATGNYYGYNGQAYYAAGGGGGAGGRVKVNHGPGYDDGITFIAEGGDAGASGYYAGYYNYPEPGEGDPGTIYLLEIDPDPDRDHINVPYDNCPFVFNPVQQDTDRDGIGDVCDVCPTLADPNDSDGDTVCDNVDVCNGYDDLDDDDLDGVPKACDNCPIRANTTQIDQDGDGAGDACDVCPLPEDPIDSDGDDVCDNVDMCPGKDDRTDTDLDGLPNDCDICPTAADIDQLDSDGDGRGDACDRCPDPADPVDSDNDGVCDSVDACPGFFDGFDDDGDGIPNACDACPQDALNDADRDGLCANQDMCPFGGDGGPDSDNDGVPTFCDNCPDQFNPTQGDTDRDTYGDVCDCAPGIGTAYPGAPETCNAFDDDCDGVADNNVIDASVWYADVDRDGYGDARVSQRACNAPLSYVANDEDCNDNTSAAAPDGVEVCDGIDNDCDGVVDPVSLACPSDEPDVPTTPDPDPNTLTTCGCSSQSGMAPMAGLFLLMPWLLRRRRSA